MISVVDTWEQYQTFSFHPFISIHEFSWPIPFICVRVLSLWPLGRNKFQATVSTATLTFRRTDNAERTVQWMSYLSVHVTYVSNSWAEPFNGPEPEGNNGCFQRQAQKNNKQNKRVMQSALQTYQSEVALHPQHTRVLQHQTWKYSQEMYFCSASMFKRRLFPINEHSAFNYSLSSACSVRACLAYRGGLKHEYKHQGSREREKHGQQIPAVFWRKLLKDTSLTWWCEYTSLFCSYLHSVFWCYYFIKTSGDDWFPRTGWFTAPLEALWLFFSSQLWRNTSDTPPWGNHCSFLLR